MISDQFAFFMQFDENKDLIKDLYHGSDTQALEALKKLRLDFEDEMNRLNELNYGQERV